MESEETKKTRIKQVVGVLAIAFAFVLITVLLISLLSKRETHISNGDTNTLMKSLYCSSNNPDRPFFDYAGLEAEHKVKYIFDSNENIDGISYTYENTFASENIARQAEAQLHVDYNMYMGKTNIYQEDLTPTFIVNGNELKINLFMNRNTFTLDTAIFVFLTQEDIENIDEYTLDNLKMVYESKNFSCNISE